MKNEKIREKGEKLNEYVLLECDGSGNENLLDGETVRNVVRSRNFN